MDNSEKQMTGAFTVGDVVKLKSGGHEMTVQTTDGSSVECVWSDGKAVRTQSFLAALLASSPAGLAGISVAIVYPDKHIDEIVLEMRGASTSQNDASFCIDDEAARLVLRRKLGPKAK